MPDVGQGREEERRIRGERVHNYRTIILGQSCTRRGDRKERLNKSHENKEEKVNMFEGDFQSSENTERGRERLRRQHGPFSLLKDRVPDDIRSGKGEREKGRKGEVERRSRDEKEKCSINVPLVI